VSTLSLRHVAEHCLGATGTLSVNNDLYGYVWRDEQGRLFGNLDPTVDLFPTTGLPTGRQLKTHLQRMSGRAVDVVLMLVGFEPDFSGAVDHQ
jgi:hypothetical protein